MHGGYDAAIRTLAEFLDHPVLGIDNEVGIQSGEGMSCHRVRRLGYDGGWECVLKEDGFGIGWASI